MYNSSSLKSLARADESNVLKYWEGLGYYSRAKNLKKTAAKLLAEHRGSLPEDIEQLKALPGIGEYTSSDLYISFISNCR